MTIPKKPIRPLTARQKQQLAEKTSASAGRTVRPARRTPSLPDAEKLWVLNVPYADRGVANANGAVWDAVLRQSVYRGSVLPAGLEPYRSELFSWERWVENSRNEVKDNRIVGDGSFTPRPHQVEAARLIGEAERKRARGFLLADDVGVGKTVSAWKAVKTIQKNRGGEQNVLVVCPLAVVPHWRRTIKSVGAENLNVVVINYDRIKKLLTVPETAKKAKRTRTKNKRISSQGTSVVDWDVIIFDESHKLKNQSQRTAAAARIAQYHKALAAKPRPPFLLWMSATAGQNPVELSYLAPLLAQVTRSPSGALKDFGPWLLGQKFNVVEDPRWKKWSWTDDAGLRQEDIERMRRLLFERKTPVALRRLPSDISGWPELVRVLMPVELEVEERKLYSSAWTEFRDTMRLVRRGKDPKGGLAAQIRFRQKASLIRVEGTVNHIVDLLDNGLQVAVSCQFLESLDTIRVGLERKKILVSVMDGRNPQGRETERLRFQRGETEVVLFTPAEGFSLHQSELLADGEYGSDAARAMVVHDPRYSGIEALQIEGRTHRDGKSATVYYMFSEDTVEEDIVKTLLGRLSSTKALVGDETNMVEELLSILNGEERALSD